MAQGSLDNREKEFRGAFDAIDKDGDGRISVQELETVMELCGGKLSQQQLKVSIKDIDDEGNGTVTFEEFMRLMPEASRNLTPRDVFKIFDKDGNGSIDVAEFKVVMEKMQQKVTVEDIEAMIQDVDKDGSGTIDYEEFLHLISESKN